jgi:hypothetical protein
MRIPLATHAGEVWIAQGLPDLSCSSSWGWQVPIFQLQAGHSAELCGIAGDQRKNGRTGVACQQHVVRADHAALGFQEGANAPGFLRGLSVKNRLANRGQHARTPSRRFESSVTVSMPLARDHRHPIRAIGSVFFNRSVRYAHVRETSSQHAIVLLYTKASRSRHADYCGPAGYPFRIR